MGAKGITVLKLGVFITIISMVGVLLGIAVVIAKGFTATIGAIESLWDAIARLFKGSTA
jgi:hypothetical protein